MRPLSRVATRGLFMADGWMRLLRVRGNGLILSFFTIILGVNLG